MIENNVNLDKVIWVVGVSQVDKKEKIIAIPYIIRKYKRGFEDLVDLTYVWATSYNRKVLRQDIVAQFQTVHNAEVVKMLNSVDAVREYVTNHENKFKDEIEKIEELGIDDAVPLFCSGKVLGIENGADFIMEVENGAKIQYLASKDEFLSKENDFVL